MKTIKITKKQAEQFELENLNNWTTHNDDQCGKNYCAGNVDEYEYEASKDRRVFHVCSECGAVEIISI